MNVRLQGMLAVSAVTAFMLASAGIAQADGMVGAAPVAYERPALWSGIYAGFESGWDHEQYDQRSRITHLGSSADRDVTAYGLYLGVQRQYGNWVAGLEFNIVGTQNDHPAQSLCPNTSFKCTGRMEDILMIGPRLGWAAGNWMPYVTGGYANGGVHFRAFNVAGPASTTGVFVDEAYQRQDGWFVGAGLDWKLAAYAIVGIDYKHIDLGDDHTIMFATGGNTAPAVPVGGIVDRIRQSATADQVMLRASLLLNHETAPAMPLK